MEYTPTEWLRRISQFPDRYALVDLGGGLFTITPSEGNIIQEGTPLSEAALNNLETQYDKANANSTANSILRKIQQFKGVFWFNNHWLPAGMVTNAVTGTGSIAWYCDYAKLSTGTTGASYAQLTKNAQGLSGGYSWDKKRSLGIYLYIQTYSAQYIHLNTGYLQPNLESTNARHVGFKIIHDVIRGTVADGTAESVLDLETLTEGGYRRLECVLTPGVECRFYIDGVDKGAITTNLPSGTGHAEYFMNISAYNTEAVGKIVTIHEFRVFQEE